MFSRRVPSDLAPNRIAAQRAAVEPRFDLTLANPTSCGIPYPDGLLDPLCDPAGLVYRPHPRGRLSARQAVAEEYRRHGATVDPERVTLTASTSEAYAFLFKLLADPADAVLVPSPSYPLFEHLALAEGIEPVPYHLEPDLGWRPDLHALAAAPANVRAVVVVHPNNPTGSFVHPDDRAALSALAAERGWAIIADEVFLDYPLAGGPGAGSSFAATGAALTFTLGGLSKSLGLPQLKLAWIVVGGPERDAAAAVERLEFIADTYLSVATPVQLALPSLCREARAVRDAILARCRLNLETLQRAVHAAPALGVRHPGGGWNAVLDFPAVVGEEALVLELLERDSVAVHPGYFFDFPRPGVLVLSLLPEPERFAEAVSRVLARIQTHL